MLDKRLIYCGHGGLLNDSIFLPSGEKHLDMTRRQFC